MSEPRAITHTLSRYGVRAAAALALLAPALWAQPASRAIRGVAFDSVNNRPLARAVVRLQDSSRVVTADDSGRFRIENLTPGVRILEVAHPSLDSMGLSSIVSEIEVPDTNVVISVPSFETIWDSRCDRDAPADSGFVFGTVANAETLEPIAGATVTLVWVNFIPMDSARMTRRRYRATVRSDEAGGYALCGTPLKVVLRMQGVTDSLASGLFDVQGMRLQRRDFLLGPRGATSVAGSVVGMVKDTLGHPIANARATVESVPEVRSDANGRFVLSNVPAGTRQVSVTSIGSGPAAFSVNVAAGDTAYVLVHLQPVQLLAAVNVTAMSTRGKYLVREFEERRLQGIGFVRDSSQISTAGTLASIFFGAPSMTVRPARMGGYLLYLPGKVRNAGDTGQCLANLWIDNFKSDYDMLNSLRPDDIAAIEVYPREMLAPMRYMQAGCGSVVVWTKYAFR